MKHLKNIVKEYQEKYLKEEVFDNTLSGDVKRIQKLLLDEKFLPSAGLKSLFNKLLRRVNYPMEVAIVGQFSSGKSTFLNALLSRDILPTGITPVTSKVNYINYAKEYKLKITYKNGANEYHPLASLGDFTDQRHTVQDIKYITLYAPMEILKDISFVDTPGLNSKSFEDTYVTKKILRDVDGIIWLTLLDNAGKESESEILREYLANFRDKSLCVLNQKDKFEDEQVQQTLSYVKENFADFFSQVIPISAKQALDSRVNQKNVLIDYALDSMQKAFKKSSTLHKDAKDLSFFKDEFEKFSHKIENINKHDSSDDEKKMKDSNISEVLNFIETTIRPQAKVSKAYSIKKDLNDICDILIKEYEIILGVYGSLISILNNKESEVLEAFDEVKIKHSKVSEVIYNQIESIMQFIADAIYENIKTKDSIRYEQEKGVFGNNKITSHNYEAIYVDIEAIFNKLFYDRDSLDKKIKISTSYFESIEQQSSEDLQDVFYTLKNSVELWQKSYELIEKNREIASDLEFSNTRQFVSKVYENIILAYDRSILENTKALHKKFAYFNGAISYSYKQMTRESIYLVNEKIITQTKSYEKNPLKYSVNTPSMEDILEVVKRSFTFEKMELFLISRRNYLYNIIQTAKQQFKEINLKQTEYVISKQQNYIDKINELKKIKTQI